MKQEKLILKLVFILAACALLLTACSDADWDLVFDTLIYWAEVKGWWVDNQIKLDNTAIKLVEDTVGELTQSAEAVQLGGLDVIRQIERAQALSDEAISEMNPDKIQAAKDLRPYDWTIREKEAVLYGALNDPEKAADAIRHADGLLSTTVEIDTCFLSRRAQLENRLQLTWDKIMELEGGPGIEKTALELRKVHEATRQELREMNQTGRSSWCISLFDW